ncbi:MAG: aldo/keto reductase [Mycobacteriales bacterium]
MAKVPTITFTNGVTTPQLGFGTFQTPPDTTADAVMHALEVGYRSIDTAAIYGNEEGVGEAIARSGIDREDLFITTKLWNSEQGTDSALAAFDASLAKLGLDYVDLYLIHWPVASKDRYVETWRALEKLATEGRARSIGVSNFQVAHLQRLFNETETVPVLNQIELHSHLSQAPLREFHARHDIVTQAWSPLARGGALLADDTVVALAKQHGKTPAQIVLRWHIQLGNVVIPKSATPSRIAENFEIFDFTLSARDMDAIATLETGERTGPDPDVFG